MSAQVIIRSCNARTHWVDVTGDGGASSESNNPAVVSRRITRPSCPTSDCGGNLWGLRGAVDGCAVTINPAAARGLSATGD